jgi:uncharacterized damage-inducible protein DinB
MNYVISMIEYDKWANSQCLKSIESARNLSPRALSLFSHILAAQQIWMSRIKQREHGSPWHELTIEECRQTLQKNYDEYLELVSWLRPEELKREIRYTDTQGKQWSANLRDILSHVANHGTYHRGQIAMLLRNDGDEPVPTDFIITARKSIG